METGCTELLKVPMYKVVYIESNSNSNSSSSNNSINDDVLLLFEASVPTVPQLVSEGHAGPSELADEASHDDNDDDDNNDDNANNE